MTRLILALLLCLLSSQPALAALTLDGTPATASSTTNPVIVAVTTPSANDVIVLLIAEVATSPATVSTVTGCGVTWAKRASQTFGPSGGYDAEEWYAVAATPLSACNVTVTFTTAAAYSNRLYVAGVNGANLTAPFDANGSLPAAAQFVDTTKNISATFTTTNPNTFLVGFLTDVGGLGTITLPTGFSTLSATGSVAASSYGIVSAAQSGVTATWSWTGGSTSRAILVDAIQAAGGAPVNSLLNTGF